MSATAAPVIPAPVPRSVRAVRACVRPGCGRRATTTLRFDYAERIMMLDPLGSDSEPGEYDLCLHHAARSTPPTGWTLRDRAPSPAPATETAPPAGPDRGPGVARLAAALSAVPRAVSEDALDAAPAGAGRSVGGGSDTSGMDVAAERSSASPPSSSMRVEARLDALLRPSSPATHDAVRSTRTGGAPESRIRTVPLSERTPEVVVRAVSQPLRLAPDPTKTVWCAELLTGTGAPGAMSDGVTRATDVRGGARDVDADVPADGPEAPTLFA